MPTQLERAAENVRKAREKAEDLARLAKERSQQRAAEAARLAAEKKLERLAKAQSAKQQAEARRAELVLADAQRRADHKRRYHVGALAHEAGLFARTNAELAALFAILGRASDMADLPDLLAVVFDDNTPQDTSAAAAKKETDSPDQSLSGWGRSAASSAMQGT